MKDQHFTVSVTMVKGDPTVLDWSICQTVKKLVSMSGDFGENAIAARAMLAFIGHACETGNGDVLMFSVDAHDGDEDSQIFITNGTANPLLRNRKIIPNHRYVIFKNCGILYDLHYVSGSKVPQALPGYAFEMGDRDPSMF